MPGRKQWNLNLFVVMFATMVSAINCRIVRKLFLCYFTLHFTFQRWKVHFIERFQLWTYNKKILLYRFLFRSCCLCVSLFIHSFRLSLPWNSPRSSRKNDCVHCLSSCTIWSLGFLSGLSLYWNNIFIENSFCIVLSKPQRVKLLSKSKRRRHWNLPFSGTISMVSLKQSQQYLSTTPHTLVSGVIYSRLTFLRSFSFHIFSKPTICPLEIAAFNHGFLIQSNSSLWKY